MSDLKGRQLQNSYQDVLTKGTGSTPIEDGDGNSFFYEEGTWTPEFIDLGGRYEYSHADQDGYYVKAGNKITLFFRCDVNDTTDTGGSAGSLVIEGLPFVSLDEPGFRAGLALAFYRGPDDLDRLGGSITGSQSFIFVRKSIIDSGEVVQANVQADDFDRINIHGSITYFKDFD